MPLYGEGFSSSLAFKIRNTEEYFNIVDPTTNEAVSSDVIDEFDGVVVTLTGVQNSQTVQIPSKSNSRSFTVVNSSDSTDILTVNEITIQIGDFHVFVFEGGSWNFDHLSLLNQGSLSTCLISGCVPSVNISDPSKFDISAGVYSVVSLADGILKPTVNIINYTGSVGNTLTYLTTSDLTALALDENQNIIELPSVAFEKQQLRKFVVIGTAIHSSRTTIESGFNVYTATPRGEIANNLYDLAGVFDNVNYKGSFKGNPNGNNLNLDISSGIFFRMGVNRDEYDNPNFIDAPAFPNLTFWQAFKTIDGSTDKINFGVTSIVPGLYDDGTALQSDSLPNGIVSNNKYSIHHLYYDPKTRIAIVQFGRNEYDTMSEAYINRELDLGEFENPTAGVILKLTYIIVKGNATNLSDPSQARFVEGPTIRGITSGGGSSSGSTSLQRAYNNSEINPEILTNSINGAINIRGYGGGDNQNVLEIQNFSGTVNFSVKANGIVNAVLPVYANDGAAGTGGLVANDMYKTSTGEIRIKL